MAPASELDVRKLVSWVLGVLLGTQCLYLVAANSFLWFGGVRRLFADTNSVNATFRRAWTVVPGRVEIRDLRVIFQDHNLEWALDLRRTTVTLRLDQLIRRVFHATHVRAEGVRFRMRHRIDPESAHDAWVGALPRIPEFPGPAVFEARVPEPPIPDSEYKLWTVQLDDVNVGVSEIWVQAFRYLGHGRARGQFLLRPARWLWVGPASLELEPGTLSVSAFEAAHGLHGRITCLVSPFDVRVPTGMAVFRFISANIALQAPDASPAFSSLFAAKALRGALSEHGSFALDVRVEHGVIAPGSQLEATIDSARFVAREPELAAEHVRLRASALAAGKSEVVLDLEGATLDRKLARGPPPLARRAELVLSADNLDTTQDFRFRELRLERSELEFPDLRTLDDLLEKSGLQLAGKASVHVAGRYTDSAHRSALVEIQLGSDAELAGRGGTPRVRMRQADLKLELHSNPGAAGAMRIAGKGSFELPRATFQDLLLATPRAELELELVRDGAGRGALDGMLRTRELSVETTAHASSCSRFTAREARLDVRARLEPRQRAELDAKLRAAGSKLSWGDFVAQGDLAMTARIEHGATDRGSGSVRLIGARIHSGNGNTAGWSASVPELVLGYAITREATRLEADLNLAATRARGRIGSTSLGADLETRLTLARAAAPSPGVRGVADLRITNASLSSGQERVSNWSGAVRLDALEGSAGANLDFSAGYSARLKDATPGLAVLAARGTLPSWVARLFPLQNLELTGTVKRHCQLTDFRLDGISGGPLLARGRLLSVSSGFYGALLLRLSGLELAAAGLDFDADGVKVAPLAGDGWLTERDARLDERATTCVSEPPTPCEGE